MIKKTLEKTWVSFPDAGTRLARWTEREPAIVTWSETSKPSNGDQDLITAFDFVQGVRRQAVADRKRVGSKEEIAFFNAESDRGSILLRLDKSTLNKNVKTVNIVTTCFDSSFIVQSVQSQ